MESTTARAIKAKQPALEEEVERLDKQMDTLCQLVAEFRSVLGIKEADTGACPAPPRQVPQNLVEIRAVAIEDFTNRLDILIQRLAPVLEAVKDI